MSRHNATEDISITTSRAASDALTVTGWRPCPSGLVGTPSSCAAATFDGQEVIEEEEEEEEGITGEQAEDLPAYDSGVGSADEEASPPGELGSAEGGAIPGEDVKRRPFARPALCASGRRHHGIMRRRPQARGHLASTRWYR